MRATLAVAVREIVERKILFLGAFVTGLLPLGFPLIPALRGNSRDARSLAVLLGGAIVAVALSLAFGATVLVVDIAQKRLSFYLSRPISSLSIWGGKILGAFSITAACVTLIVAPIFFLEGESAFSAQTGRLGSPRVFLFTFMGILLLVLLAHASASIVRLRSAWIVPDFFLALIFPVSIAFSLRSLVAAGFWDRFGSTHSEWPIWALVLPLLAILLVVSYVQIADGRADARRSHGALSATLWGTLLVVALPLAGLSWWVKAWSPRDSLPVSGHAAPRGTWLTLSGRLRARGSAEGTFLYDPASGRAIKRESRDSGNDVTFSSDGSRAAWAEERLGFFEGKGEPEVFVADLTRATAVKTGISCESGCRVALSPSGRRLALVDALSVAAYDVTNPGNPKSLATFRMKSPSAAFAFIDDETIRLFPFDLREARGHAPASLEIEELSLSSKTSLVTGHVDAGSLAHLRPSADGRFLVGSDDKKLTLHDARTGALLTILSDDLATPTMRFLSGNRVVVAGISNGNGVLKIFLDGGRTPPFVLGLGPAASLLLGGEVAPGRIALSLNPFQRNDERARRAWKLIFVNVATGAISPGPEGLVPLDLLWWRRFPTLPPAEAGLPSSFLFLDAENRLVRLDPATNTRTVLLGRSK